MDKQASEWYEAICDSKIGDGEKHSLVMSYNGVTAKIYLDFYEVLSVKTLITTAYSPLLGSTATTASAGKLNGDYRIYDFEVFNGVHPPEELIGLDTSYSLKISNEFKYTPTNLQKPTISGTVSFVNDIKGVLVSDKLNSVYGVVADA